MKKDGGSAYPSHGTMGEVVQEGMTVRQRYKCAVLTGLLSCGVSSPVVEGEAVAFDIGVAKIADAMILEDMRNDKDGNISSVIMEFLLHEKVGMSSRAICDRYVCGCDFVRSSHPCDPSDLNRCVTLLDATGIDIRIMTGVSPEWDSLVERWDELIVVYREEETGISAPWTYALMKEILHGCRH